MSKISLQSTFEDVEVDTNSLASDLSDNLNYDELISFIKTIDDFKSEHEFSVNLVNALIDQLIEYEEDISPIKRHLGYKEKKNKETPTKSKRKVANVSVEKPKPRNRFTDIEVVSPHVRDGK
jgi:hypothetical protein